MECVYKEVYFQQYCKICKHELEDEAEDTCHECLQNPTNINSHKPVKYEEKD